MSGGGAVLVVVEAQGAGLCGGCFFVAEQVVLVGVDGGLVGFDGLDRAAGEAAELVGVEPLGFLDQGCFDVVALLWAEAGG